MMSRYNDNPKVHRNLEQITCWMSPHYGMKARLRAIKAIDFRMTESRICEDALLMYMPMLEQRLQPNLNDHRRKKSA